MRTTTLSRIMQYCILFFIGIFLLPDQVKASHIVGGEIGYRCLGGGRYQIELSIYRDCFYGGDDAPFDQEASVGVFNGRTGRLIQELRIPFVKDDTLSGIFQDDCLIIPGDVCVHTSVYTAEVVLPTINDGYSFVYQRCCRNQTIANIVNPLEAGATYSISLTRRAMEVCNSTPKFNEWPPIFVCVDEPIFYNHSATDIDGDSLAYELFTPFSGGTLDMPQPQPPSPPPFQQVQWSGGVYNINNVLGAGRALRIDERQGFLFAQPSLQGQFVVGVAVKEYRNGELLSITRRDFQYNIGTCREIGAALSAPEVQCNDLEVTFENISRDADDFIWNFDLAGDATAVSNEQSPTYTYPDTGTYVVRLVVEPSSICSDTMLHIIELKENPIEARASVETFSCSPDTTVVTLIDETADSTLSIVNRFWEVRLTDTTLNLEGERPSFLVSKNLSGQITLQVEFEDRCVQTTDLSFAIEPNDPTASIPDVLSVCRGDSIALNPAADPASLLSFRWRPALAIDNPNTINPTVAPRDTTVYTARVISPRSLCDVEKEVTVNVIPNAELLNFNAEADCVNGLRFDFSAQVENADSIRWDFGDTTTVADVSNLLTPSYTYPDTGKYVFTLRLFSGDCMNMITDTVEVLAAEAVDFDITAGDDIETCEATVTLQATPTNIENYAWYNAQDSLIAFNRDITVPTEGNTFYTARVQNETGCVIRDTVRIIGKQPNFAINEDTTLCSGETILLQATNLSPLIDSLSYNWSTPDGNIVAAANTANPDVELMFGEQTFTVVAENRFGCIDSSEVIITLIDSNYQLGFDANVQCDESSVLFVNTSSDSTLRYKWLTGDTNQSTALGDSLLYRYDQAGDYIACLTIDYNASCVDTLCQPLQIDSINLSADFAIESISCTEDSTVVEFSTLSDLIGMGATFEWRFNDSIRSQERKPVLTFFENDTLSAQLVVQQSEQCVLTKSDTFQFVVLGVEVDSLYSICRGNQIRLNENGNSDLRYRWTPSATFSENDVFSPFVMPAQTTDYIVVVQDPRNPGCRIQKDFTVEVTDGLELDLPDVINACAQETMISVPENIVADVTWTDDTGATFNGQNFIIPADYQGGLLVQAMDSIGCSGQDSITIENKNGLNITKPIGDTVLTCEGKTVLIILENQNPGDSISISYFPNDFITMGDSTLRPTIFGFQDTILNLYFEATNQFGCSLRDSMAIKIRDFEINLPTEVSVCRNNPTELNPSFNPMLSYEWSPATGLSDPNIGNPTAILNEERTYNVTVTLGQNAGACRQEQMVQVSINPDTRLQVSRDTALCAPAEILLSAQADQPVEYLWSDDASFEMLLSMDSSLTVLPDIGIVDYYVRAIDSFGCATNNLVTISTLPVDVEIADTTKGCIGEFVNLEATNVGLPQQLNFEWLPAEIVREGAGSSTPVIEGEDGLLVTGIASNQLGCTDTIQTYLEFIDLDADNFSITANPDTVFLGSSSRLNVNLDDSFDFTWSPNFSLDRDDVRNPLATPFETTTYAVDISKGSCSARRFIEIFVTQGECAEPFIFVPSGFTPNQDGKNDVLFVRGVPISEVYFAVYNRWGQKLFETTDLNVGWDGTFKGKQLPPDVYAYYLEVVCNDGEEFFKKGDVTILR